MKIRTCSRAAAGGAAGGACLVLIAAAAIAGKPGSGDLVARVGQTVVTRDDFERQFGRQPPPPEASADSARQAFLESLIHKELLVLEARERGLGTLSRRRQKSSLGGPPGTCGRRRAGLT
jgi:hypothetical protein